VAKASCAFKNRRTTQAPERLEEDTSGTKEKEVRTFRLTLFFLIGACLLASTYGAFFMFEGDYSEAGNAMHTKCCDAQGYSFLAALAWCIFFLKSEPNYVRGFLIAVLVILGFGMLVYK